MKRITIALTTALLPFSIFAANPVVTGLCQNEHEYMCIKTKKGDTWESLFSNREERVLVKKLNRINLQLRPHMVVVIPRDLNVATLNELSPMPQKAETHGEKMVIVDQKELAFGAYDQSGNLVYWGPISAGKSYCPDTEHACRTVTGEFTVYRKQGAQCVSHEFPLGKGGAKTPYCMFFHGGYALHGSYTVPGYNDSHGCVRMFPEDARWLNEEFVDVNRTKVIVKPAI